MSYANTASGSGKLVEITAAFVEVWFVQSIKKEKWFVLQIIEDFQQKAIAKGSEDPQSVSILQKCEEFLPGQVNKDYLAVQTLHPYYD